MHHLTIDRAAYDKKKALALVAECRLQTVRELRAHNHILGGVRPNQLIADMCVDMCVERCVDMCGDMCVDVCVDVC